MCFAQTRSPQPYEYDHYTNYNRLVPCLYPIKGFHWIRFNEDLTSQFETRALATNQSQS